MATEATTIAFSNDGDSESKHVGHNVPSPTQMRNWRPTYSVENANKYRPLFDAMLTDRQNKKISSAACGLKPNTIYLQAQDALKWLAENHPTKSAEYSRFRQQVSMGRRPDGVSVFFKPNIANLLAAATSSSSTGEEPWREQLQKWLETAQSGNIWNSLDTFPNGLRVSDADKAWLYGLLAPLEGVEIEVTENYIRVMR